MDKRYSLKALDTLREEIEPTETIDQDKTLYKH